MENHRDHGCGKIGARMGLLSAVLGVVTAAIILSTSGIWTFLNFQLDAPMIVGLIALFVASGYFGRNAGVYLCERGNRVGLDILVGIGLAFGSIAIAAFAGSVFYLFFHDRNISIGVNEIPMTLFAPMLAIMVFGAIPAIALGVTFGLFTGMQLEKLRQVEDVGE